MIKVLKRRQSQWRGTKGSATFKQPGFEVSAECQCLKNCFISKCLLVRFSATFPIFKLVILLIRWTLTYCKKCLSKTAAPVCIWASEAGFSVYLQWTVTCAYAMSITFPSIVPWKRRRVFSFKLSRYLSWVVKSLEPVRYLNIMAIGIAFSETTAKTSGLSVRFVTLWRPEVR